MNDPRIIERAELTRAYYGASIIDGYYRLLDFGPDVQPSANERLSMDLCNEIVVMEAVAAVAERERQWSALERLLAAIPPGGSYEEVVHLPRAEAIRAVRDAATLGWIG